MLLIRKNQSPILFCLIATGFHLAQSCGHQQAQELVRIANPQAPPGEGLPSLSHTHTRRDSEDTGLGPEFDACSGIPTPQPPAPRPWQSYFTSLCPRFPLKLGTMITTTTKTHLTAVIVNSRKRVQPAWHREARSKD